VGRINADVAVWLSKCMDQDIAHFEGFVVDCPATLTVGCDLLLEIRAYLLRSAFPQSLSQGISFASRTNNAGNWRAETAESEEEKKLRERKVSLVRLFKACTLRASLSNDVLRGHQASEELGSDAMMEQYGGEENVMAPGSSNNTPAEKKSSPKPSQENGRIGAAEGEDADAPDVDDGTELSENQLENVYSKAQLHDTSLPEVEPAEEFALTLRPYQKQALGWMLRMEEKKEGQKKEDESEDASQRALSLHPLWQEYRFPVDEERMDLLDTAAPAFYFNPYTGHLSLQFQHASRGACGGILADEMGLGKTIQMAALILTNQSTGQDNSSEEEDEESKRENGEGSKQQLRQMSLASSFAAAGGSESNRKALLKSLSFASQGKATLVVAPMSLIGQWRDELERAVPSMTSMLYYAEQKGDLLARLEGGSVDTVITSYGTLVTEYKKLVEGRSASARQVASTAPLYAVEWLRVILDEAHQIKNKETKNSKACSELLAKRRWCLTGTPIVNRLTDLYSLLRFLRVEPWGDFSFFNSFISKPFANKNQKALEVVQVVLESVLIRREKKMKDKDGKPIVDLPPKKLNIVRLKFSPLERLIYDSVYDRAYMQYQTLAAAGTISRNFSFIFSVLMRLRQAVCHPMLVLKKAKKQVKEEADEEHEGESESVLGEHEEQVKKLIAAYQSGYNTIEGVEEAATDGLTIEALEEVLRNQEEDNEDKECPFCFEEKSETSYLPCKHWGCKQCITEHLQMCENNSEEATCPTCRAGPVSTSNIVSAIRTRPRKNRIAEIVEEQDEKEEKSNDEEEVPPSSQHSQPAVFFRKNDFRSSTKLEALIEHLNQLRYEDPTFKGVIFSQFTSFLDLVEVILRKNHHAFVRLDGTTSQKDREAVLKEFSTTPKRMLILISLRAGGVGLNLVAANHVWLLDCWWNSSTEDQAVDRVHRLGQTKQVYVHRFIIDESIEDRILAIQARKTALVGAALAGTRGPNEKSEALQNLELLFA
jgi:DNA repair protein RAD5